MKTYSQIAEAMTKRMEYAQAIEYLLKADQHAAKNDCFGQRFTINYRMAEIYSKMGLQEKGKEYWKIAHLLSNKVDHTHYLIFTNRYKGRCLESNNQYNLSIPYRLHNISYFKKKTYINGVDKYEYALEYSWLVYDYLKSNQLDEAKKSIAEMEVCLKQVPAGKSKPLWASYYLYQGMICAEENNNQQALEWFDRAKKEAWKTSYIEFVKIITQEEIRYTIGSMGKANFKIYQSLEKKNIKEIEKLNKRLIPYKTDVLVPNNKIKIWKGVLVLQIVFTVILFVFKEKAKKKFNRPQREVVKLILKNDIRVVQNSKAEEVPLAKQGNGHGMISKSKESELLQILIKFEQGSAFTARNFTISNLATILNTNTKYIHYLLKVHRNKNFNGYINGLKINYIIRQLNENPKYLHYKISYLSEMGGFSSQSRFAFIFKKEIGLSPSEYIGERLNKKKV
ncbi:helix-turn-helix domain-containing protein [Elizabethkingia argentiflava]|uniref:Helix-turn-helix domain-containing protein n=1 Tax=Elizabethkingia argenteiflava TaxID=2681556 RepID=A0A845PQA3_9FLAO|nr:helix-turn-helix domain-containing protein [Elizabethkingia argenteiflava]NAW50352.1 helix-turn-helix domain-containing protein [Elizabethkingia argenteiflava]